MGERLGGGVKRRSELGEELGGAVGGAYDQSTLYKFSKN